jgi:hypothetical protein
MISSVEFSTVVNGGLEYHLVLPIVLRRKLELPSLASFVYHAIFVIC